MVGFFVLEEHYKCSVGIGYVAGGGVRRCIGGVYLWPNTRSKEMMDNLGEMARWDILVGDFNSRHTSWDHGSYTSQMGRILRKWAEEDGFTITAPNHPTFRDVSTIDLLLSKSPTKNQYSDRAACEHLGQISRLDCLQQPDHVPGGILWRKVDRKALKIKLSRIADRNGGWDDITDMIAELPRAKIAGGRNCDWWGKETERMSLDVKSIRRRRRKDNDEGWKLARSIYRNTILNQRYTYLKDKLVSANDKEIFKIVRNLEERRTIPCCVDEAGNRLNTHESMSDEFAKQLFTEVPVQIDSGGSLHERLDIDISMDDVQFGLHASPSNTAPGHDAIGYLILRMWFQLNKDHITRVLKELINNGYLKWSEAVTVLIPKASKKAYNIAKSGRMIHLLPAVSKVVDRIILAKMERSVTLGTTQYGSRKHRSCHDSVKQLKDFLVYHNYKNSAIMTTDVAGGFDNIDINCLLDMMNYGSCDLELVHWTRRWMNNRTMRMKFNGHISKQYPCNKGVPQGSPLSPFLFCIYIPEVFASRFRCSPGLSRLVTS